LDANTSNNLDTDVAGRAVPAGANGAHAVVACAGWRHVAADQRSCCTVCLGRGVSAGSCRQNCRGRITLQHML
jgi:hypothetical protein